MSNNERIEQFITQDPKSSNNEQSDSTLLEPNKDYRTSALSQRTFFDRWFGKINEGSLRGSVFTLASIALGTGAFALPMGADQMSLTMALIMLIVGACVTYWTLYIMILSSRKIGTADYSEVVKNYYSPLVSKILDMSIILYIFLTLISYMVIILTLIGRFIYEINGDHTEYPTPDDFLTKSFYSHTWFKLIISAVIIAAISPLCLMKDISKLRIASLFGIGSLLFMIIVVVGECPFYFKHYLDTTYDENDKSTWPNLFNVGKGFTSALMFFRCSATIFFAFTCHVGAFPIYRTLNNNEDRRIKKVFRRSVILIFSIYLLVTVCGFLTQPYKTPSLIIFRDKLFDNDIIMIIAQLLLSVTLTLAIPSNYQALRLSVLQIFCKTNEIETKNNLMITFITLVCVGTVASAFNNITTYLNCIGGFLSPIIAFMFPVLIYVKSNNYPITHWKNIVSLVIVAILVIIGWTAGVATVIAAINEASQKH